MMLLLTCVGAMIELVTEDNDWWATLALMPFVSLAAGLTPAIYSRRRTRNASGRVEERKAELASLSANLLAEHQPDASRWCRACDTQWPCATYGFVLALEDLMRRTEADILKPHRFYARWFRNGRS